MARILIVEDDENIADFIKRGLFQKGYEVEVASTGTRGLELAKAINPDVVILDLILPDMDGIDVCREMRFAGDMGIIILTARQLVGDRVMGLEAGADDYLPKPFAFEELAARIKSILRRKKNLEEIIRVAGLEIDPKSRQVRRDDRVVELSNREFELLKLLAENTGRPLRHEHIIQRVWGEEYESNSSQVKVYINLLRQKLDAGGKPNLIHSLRGFGYVLEDRP